MKKFLVVLGLFTGTVLGQGTLGQDLPPGQLELDIPVGEIIERYEDFWQIRKDEGVDVERLPMYKNFQRWLDDLQYVNGFPNFTMQEYIDDNLDWVKSSMDYDCENTSYPFLTFNEVGPTEHCNIEPGSGASQGTGQIHYIEIHPSNPDRMYACTNYGGLFLTDDAGASWTPAGTDNNLPMTSVSSVALSKTADPALNWFISTGNAEFHSSSVLYPSTGIWRTSDGGETYQNISFPLPGSDNELLYKAVKIRKVISSMYAGSTRLVAASMKGLFRCENAHAINPVWTKIADGVFYDVEFSPDNPSIIYACGDDETPLIRYDLNTWTSTTVHPDMNLTYDMNPSNGDKRRSSIEFCDEISDKLWIMITEFYEGDPSTNSDDDSWTALWRYDITDDLFVEKKDKLEPDEIAPLDYAVGLERHMAWDVYPFVESGQVRIVWGNVGKVRMAYDDLSNAPFPAGYWTNIMAGETHADQHYLVFDDDGQELFLGNDGGFYKTDITSNFDTWQNFNNGLAISTAFRVSTSQIGERKVLASFQDMGQIRINEVSPGNWYPISVKGGDGTEDYIDPYNSLNQLASNQSSANVRRTTNQWISGSSDSHELDGSPHHKRYEGSCLNDGIIYGASQDGMRRYEWGPDDFLLHQDLGVSAEGITVANGYKTPQYVFSVAVNENPLYSEYLYVYWRGGAANRNTKDFEPDPEIVAPRIYRSKVGGGLSPDDWELVYQFNSLGWGKVAPSFSDPDIFWVTSDEFFEDTDGDGIGDVKVSGRVMKVDLSSGSPETEIFDQGLEGISYLDIKDIVYVRGSNDALYLATKRGLYYRDNDNYPDAWHKVCGLPNTPLKDLEIDYCREKLIVATYGRGIWEADLDLSTQTPLVFEDDLLINEDLFSGTSIRILSGVTVTVTADLFMSKDRKIIVDPGANLVVDGGRITNECGQLWGGIEVHGIDTEDQFGDAQGKLTCKNGALIEHAHVGAVNWKPGDYASQGGIIDMQNSTVRNCRKGVGFASYENEYLGSVYDDKSIFKNVDFYWDSDYRSEGVLGLVTMNGVHGVRFIGCDFSDLRIPADRVGPNRKGINSINTTYYVNGLCPSASCGDDVDFDVEPGVGEWDYSRFRNLEFGIWSANGFATKTMVADKTQFYNCENGIDLTRMLAPQITRNDFRWDILAETENIGIDLTESMWIKVEENQFRNYEGGNLVYTFGAWLTDLGPFNEEIYKNDLQDITWGLVSEGMNRSGISTVPGLDGLEFLCNTNISNEYDQVALGTKDGLYSSNYGVKLNNGSWASESGVTYTDELKSYEDYVNLSAHEINYWSTPANLIQEASGSVLPTATLNANQCLSNLSTGGYYEDGMIKLPAGMKMTVQSEFNQLDNQHQNKVSQYESLVLTQAEIDQIIFQLGNVTPQNQNSRRQTLTMESPYLTTEILFAAADANIIGSDHSWLKNLMISNIEAVTTDLTDHLQTKQPAMPPHMVQQIIDAKETTHTSRFYLEQEIVDLGTQRDRKAKLLLMDMKHEASYHDLSEQRSMMQQKGEVLYELDHVLTYFEEGDLVTAQQRLNMLSPNQFPLEYQSAVQDFKDFGNQLIGILNTPGKIENLTVAERQFLHDYSTQSSNHAKYLSESILCFFYDECPTKYLNIPLPMAPITDKEDKDQIDLELEIYPNPTDQLVNVVLPKSDLYLTLTLTDISGKEIYREKVNGQLYRLETSDFAPGIYFIKVSDGVELEKSTKLVIQR